MKNPKEQPAANLQQLRRERLQTFLTEQEQAGRTQREIAARTSVPRSYLNDLKAGRRPLSELYARRLAAEFAVDYAWLLGLTESPQPPPRPPSIGNVDAIPVLGKLIEGPPRSQPEWDGSLVQLSGVGLEGAAGACDSYVLRFSGPDQLGRLQPDDLVLVSQVASVSAQLHVIKLRGKLLLARRDPLGHWQALDARRAISAEPLVIGHCVGILWGRLRRSVTSPMKYGCPPCDRDTAVREHFQCMAEGAIVLSDGNLKTSLHANN